MILLKLHRAHSLITTASDAIFTLITSGSEVTQLMGERVRVTDPSYFNNIYQLDGFALARQEGKIDICIVILSDAYSYR